jgi:CBS domain-containing protein
MTGPLGDPVEIPGTERIMAGASASESSLPPPHALRTAADVMQSALSTVKPDDHVAAAAYLMKHGHATALVIVDDEQDRRPLGLITEADIVRAVADGKDVNDVRIHDLMTSDPTVIPGTTSVRDAAALMLAGHFRHLPVVDDGRLIGIVDIRDVCQALLESAPG